MTLWFTGGYTGGEPILSGGCNEAQGLLKFEGTPMPVSGAFFSEKKMDFPYEIAPTANKIK
jgi:hypothetical protein